MKYLLLWLSVFAVIITGCAEQDGYYVSNDNAKNETILLGEKSGVFNLHLSANQIGEKINIILYLNKFDRMKNNDSLMIEEIEATVNGMNFKNAIKFINFIDSKIEFNSLSELVSNKKILESNYNLQYYFQFNKLDLEPYHRLRVEILCKIKSRNESVIIKNSCELKRINRIAIVPI